MIRPDVRLALAFNEAVRDEDEWFEEPDDLDRLALALDSIESLTDPVEAAAVLAFRIARAQAFGEGNKRMAFGSLTRMDRKAVPCCLQRIEGSPIYSFVPHPEPTFNKI